MPELRFHIDRLSFELPIPVQKLHYLLDGFHTIHFETSDDRRFPRIGRRKNNPFESLLLRLNGNGQYALDRLDTSIK